MTRPVKMPKKYDDFLDGNIPAEYFEEEFLLFEEYMYTTGNTVPTTSDRPHANADFMLEKFKDFETFMKRESRRQVLDDMVRSIS